MNIDRLNFALNNFILLLSSGMTIGTHWDCWSHQFWKTIGLNVTTIGIRQSCEVKEHVLGVPISLKDFQLSLSLPSDQVIPSRRTMCSRSIPLFIVFTGDDWNTSGSNNRCTKHNSCNKHFRSLSFCPISNPDYIFTIAYSQSDHDFIKLLVMKYFCKH